MSWAMFWVYSTRWSLAPSCPPSTASPTRCASARMTSVASSTSTARAPPRRGHRPPWARKPMRSSQPWWVTMLLITSHWLWCLKCSLANKFPPILDILWYRQTMKSKVKAHLIELLTNYREHSTKQISRSRGTLVVVVAETLIKHQFNCNKQVKFWVFQYFFFLLCCVE